MSISSTVVDRAEIRFHAAAPALQGHVGCFWVITAECGAMLRIVPDGTSSIAISQPQHGFDGYLRGPLLRPLELQFTVPTTLIGVRLRPGVAFSLTGVPAHSMLNRRVQLRDCEVFRELASIDAVPRAPAQWIAMLQDLLIRALAGTSIHPLVARALDEIHATQGCLSVSDIAAHCRTSDRNLARLMRDWIGYGPKRYAGIVRFQSTLAQMERAPSSSVATLATQVGYYDQSHLTAEMGRYAGATPGHLITERVSDFSKTGCDVPF